MLSASFRHASLPLLSPSPHSRSTCAIIEIYLPVDSGRRRLQVSNCRPPTRRRLQGTGPHATFDRAASDACSRRHQSAVIDRSLTVRRVLGYFVRRQRLGRYGAIMKQRRDNDTCHRPARRS